MIRREDDNGIVRLLIDRPERRNAFDNATALALGAALDGRATTKTTAPRHNRSQAAVAAPRTAAPNHTLTRSPSVVRPITDAPGAMKTSWPIRGSLMWPHFFPAQLVATRIQHELFSSA